MARTCCTVIEPSAAGGDQTEGRASITADWADVARYFETEAVAHLATVEPDGSPNSVPLWIARHGESDLVFFSTEESRKERNIDRDARVAISITKPENSYHMATIRGEVVERVHGDRAQEIVDAIFRKYTGEPYSVRSGHTVFVVRPRVWVAREY